jgi:hypothetical protein
MAKFSASEKGTAGRIPSTDPDVVYRRMVRLCGKKRADKLFSQPGKSE